MCVLVCFWVCFGFVWVVRLLSCRFVVFIGFVAGFVMVRITVDVDRCVGCGVCRSVCPKGGRIYRIVDVGGRCLAVVMDESSCLGCKLCVSRCPTNAIRIDFGKRTRTHAVEFD